MSDSSFSPLLPRRQFLGGLLAGAGALAAGDRLFGAEAAPAKAAYRGPNVVIVRFGGGVRRRETIDPQHTYAPYFLHELCKRGTLFPKMEIASLEGVETSHGQGTLYLMTGKYDRFKDIGDKFLGARFEAKVPTVFEYLRAAYDVPKHEALLINGEDRSDEEFYDFSNHHLFGAQVRSTTLSLYRFKVHKLRRQIAEGKFAGAELRKMREELAKREALDYRTDGQERDPAIEGFWDRWRGFYGESGLVNERGDRLLTQIALRAMKELRPRLMMINYNDPDYVHWGHLSHYTRGVAIIDDGLQQLVAAADADEFYAGNTIFVIVPDCGRDSNPLVAVPCQHHFNSRSSHEIFGLIFGPGVAKGAVVDRVVDQTMVAGTVGQLMGFKAEFAEKQILMEAIA